MVPGQQGAADSLSPGGREAEIAPRISLILPTRGRPALALRLLDSAAELAARPELLEVACYIDEDDAPSRAIDHPVLALRKVVGGRTTMGRMHDRCYRACSGRLVMIMNDDVVVRTRGWDERIVEAFARHPDGIALVYGNDLAQKGRLPTFPVLSRRVIELMGHVCPPQYLGDYIDTHLFDLFNILKRRGHDRIIYLEDVVFEHLHERPGEASGIPPGRVPKTVLDERTFFEWAAERERLAGRLARAIESSQSKV